jgi:outer membrane protein assembly factor BamB
MRTCFLTMIAGALGLAGTLAGAEPMLAVERDWPQFRGPTGQGTAEGADPPLTWSPTENVAWKTPLPGSGWSSPIVYRGRVYLTTAVTDDDRRPKSLRAIGVDARSGEIVWDHEVFAPDSDAPKHSKNTHASSTPIADGDHLYVHFGPLGTACLTLDGEVLWRQEGIDYPPVHGNGSSPVLAGDKLIFNCDGGRDPFVVALHRSTGEVAWKAPRETSAAKKFSFSTPLVLEDGGRELVVSPGSGAVIAYDAASGEEVWRVDYGQGYSVVPRPVLGEGLLYVSSGFDSASVFAVRTGGRGDVTDTHVAWKASRGAPKTPSMLLVGGELYFVADNGIATCVDARTGQQHWQERIGGNVSASPVYADGRIYITTEDGRTIVIAASREFEKLAENDLGERTLASAAISGKALFIRTASNLYCIADR